MTPRSLALVLLLVAPAASGCGMLIHHPTPEWEGQVTVLSPEQRPTVLVRIAPPDDQPDPAPPGVTPPWREKDERAELLARYHAAFSLPLFSTVAYQVGTEPAGVETDYVLDVNVQERSAGLSGWTVAGMCTLGALPIPLSDDVSASITVRDGAGRLLGTAEAHDEETTVLWLPLLPLNVLFLYDHHLGLGRLLGLNITTFAQEEAAMFETLVRNALYAAHEKFHFRRPGT